MVDTPTQGRRHIGAVLLVALSLLPLAAVADPPAEFNAARAFGARESLWGLSLSPDGARVAYIAPAKGQGTTLLTVAVEPGEKPRAVFTFDGNPLRLVGCRWVSNQRLVCRVEGVVRESAGISTILPVSRWLAVNADGSNLQTLAVRRNQYSQGYFLQDGEVIDYLPDEEGAVLMSRTYSADAHLGSRVGSDREGLGVDWLDTQTLKFKSVVPPRKDAFEYISDGRGNVRIMALKDADDRGYERGKVTFFYRPVGTTDWRQLATYNERDKSGFWPMAVDPDLNVAYGLKRDDGRNCIYTVKLDNSLEEHLIQSRPDVDVDGLLQIGRRERVVGTTFVTDRMQSTVFDPAIRTLLSSLSRALPQQPLIEVTDSSVDESKLLVVAGSDADPGVYYVFDRKARHLDTFTVVRRELEGVALASVKSVNYPSADGVMVPAYLTLPPGKTDAHGLPAIVLPHGGPSSRDEWGFDWLPQYFAHQGYAVLQPEFRGSSGFGDAWFQKNGFRSWQIAVGDVLSAGRWLVKEGIADPKRLAILGWSYGGYAALQSAVVDPTVFKAVVAVAPVTDLSAVVEESREWSNYELIRALVGTGPHVRDGSPIEHVGNFKAPVLLFHGTLDANVSYKESQRFEEKLRKAGGRVTLITFENRDHQLRDTDARAELLQRSDDFFRASFEDGSGTH